MLSTQVSLVPTVSEDLDTILALEESPDNSPYIGHWERSQHQAAIVDPDIALDYIYTQLLQKLPIRYGVRLGR